MAISKTDQKVILAVLIVFLGIAIIYFCREKQLDKDGVFVVGRVTRVVEYDKGYGTTIIYAFENKLYHFNYTALPKIKDSLVFVEFSKRKPGLQKLIRDRRVPSCLKYGTILEKKEYESLSCQ